MFNYYLLDMPYDLVLEWEVESLTESLNWRTEKNSLDKQLDISKFCMRYSPLLNETSLDAIEFSPEEMPHLDESDTTEPFTQQPPEEENFDYAPTEIEPEEEEESNWQDKEEEE